MVGEECRAIVHAVPAIRPDAGSPPAVAPFSPAVANERLRRLLDPAGSGGADRAAPESGGSPDRPRSIADLLLGSGPLFRSAQEVAWREARREYPPAGTPLPRTRAELGSPPPPPTGLSPGSTLQYLLPGSMQSAADLIDPADRSRAPDGAAWRQQRGDRPGSAGRPAGRGARCA
jgi:hypothetical protein